ncbi:MAG TPA: glucose-6-phosphate dehydrogenase [Candidatus Saccharimonadia bacterium]|nr:glucose-6-phosphate dehydrogenase [Candidatus Saccharimonadia bacterium]
MKAMPPAPSALVIFGVTSNLSKHMLLPALYHLESQGQLPEKFFIVAVSRQEPRVDSLLQEAEMQVLRSGQPVNPVAMARLKDRIHPVQMDSSKEDEFGALKRLLHKLDETAGVQLNHLFYLAILPQVFRKVVGNLAASGLSREDDHHASRILVEKPFGDDLKSAQELINFMSGHFDEKQIFRIDHYLAKETAQNILTFRFNNPLIEGIWSRQFIDHIQITAMEKLTIGDQSRAAFYENMGAMRDFVQSHLMQIMALVMMEYPQGLTATNIHKEKLALLESIHPIHAEHVEDVAVRGQYTTYRDEVQNPHSNVETYAAVKLEVANSRWGGVPVLLRTGKAMAEKSTEIVVIFKDRSRRALEDNLLRIRIQPNEGISLKLVAKTPGFGNDFQPVEMQFNYANTFNGHHPEAYQRVLMDAMRGDQSLFATSDEVLASWRLLQPILDAWNAENSRPEVYKNGSWGPDSAENFAGAYGCHWINDTPASTASIELSAPE